MDDVTLHFWVVSALCGWALLGVARFVADPISIGKSIRQLMRLR